MGGAPLSRNTLREPVAKARALRRPRSPSAHGCSLRGVLGAERLGPAAMSQNGERSRFLPTEERRFPRARQRALSFSLGRSVRAVLLASCGAPSLEAGAGEARFPLEAS